MTAEELNSSGGVIATVGTAETDATGAYSLSIGSNYTGGPLLLTISGKDDTGGTQMKCDVSAGCGTGVSFGQTMTLDTTFTMTAIVPPVTSGASISAQITPYTHMAARRARATTPVDADAVNNAISEVNQMVGVNILEVPPVDITDPAQIAGASSEALTYAAFLAGAGELALAGGDLVNGLEQLAQSFEDGELTDADPVNPGDLLAAIESEGTASGLDTDPVLSQVLATLSSGISGDCATGTCSYNPQPADSATLTAVEKARDIVGQTRAWGTTLANLETPADAFGTNLETAGNVLDANSQQLEETLGLVLDAVGTALDAQAQAGSLVLGSQQVTVLATDGTTTLGTVDVTLADNSGLDISITGSNLGGVNVSLVATSNLPANDFLDGNTFQLNDADLSFTGSVSNAQASMSLDQMAFMATFDSAITIDPSATTQPDPVLTSASLSGGITLQASGASFTGSADLAFVALSSPPGNIDSVVLNKLSLSTVGLSGQFSDASGNDFSATASLTVNNATAFDTLGALACGSKDYVNTYTSFSANSLDASVVTELGQFWMVYSIRYDAQSDSTTFEGAALDGQPLNVTLQGDVLGVTSRLVALSSYSDCRLTPTAREANFYSYNWDGVILSGMLYGTLTFPPVETTDSFANLTLSLTMDLTLTGYPDTTAVLSGNRTALKGGDLTATLTHNGQSVTFAASKTDGATAGTGTVTVTTPDGTSLVVTVTENATTGTVKVNGTTVGTVEEAGNGLLMVRYSDGTFETLQ